MNGGREGKPSMDWLVCLIELPDLRGRSILEGVAGG